MKRRSSVKRDEAFAYAEKYDIDLDVHNSGDVLWIDQLVIPENLRRSGHGSHVIKLLERDAKKYGIKRIRLYAADEGEGRTNEFWDQLGYHYDCSDCEEYEEAAWYMSKQLK